MELRDKFALEAMKTFLALSVKKGMVLSPDEIADAAWDLADRVVARRNAKRPEKQT